MNFLDLKCQFRCKEPIEPYHHYGSTWRGVLGKGLRCVTGEEDAPTAAKSGGFYQAFFHKGYCLPALRNEVMPYTLNVPWVSDPTPAHTTSLRMRIFGPATEYVGLVVHALQAGAEMDFGAKHQNLQLQDVGLAQHASAFPEWQSLSQLSANPRCLSLWDIPPLPATPIVVQLHSPLRLKHENALLKHNAAFLLKPFVLSAIRRVNDFRVLSGGDVLPPLPRSQYDSLESALLERELTWRQWHYWSSREQKQRILGGLTGTITLNLQHHPALWPYLFLAQFTQVGLSTTKGLGGFRIGLFT